MAENYEEFFNSIKPLCVGYIEATHLLTHMRFIRAKAGSINKAHKISSEDGFQALFDVLIQNDDEDKWKKYYKALKESEFNSVCRLYEFMETQAKDFDSYCKIFHIFSTEISTDQLNIIAFANALKSGDTITDNQLQEIISTEQKEGIKSAAILLFAQFPCILSSLMQDLDKCLNFMNRRDLLNKINEAVTFNDEEICNEEICSSNNRDEMIKYLHDVIVNSVDPRDIWNQLSIDLGLPTNKIEFFNKRDTEKIMDMFDKSSYQGKFQSLCDALSNAGYEQLYLQINGKTCHDTENKSYKQMLETQHKEVVEKILTTPILDPLYHANVINKREKEEIASLRDTKGEINAAQLLLERVPLKKDMWFNDFFQILIKNKQRNLVRIIDPDYRSDGEADTDSDNNYEDDQSQIQRSVTPNEEKFELRDYQKELISQALLGKNCIIAAPTGSGKTVMARKIIEHHLDKNVAKSYKVVFLCNQTTLAEQQGNVLRKAFPGWIINIIYGFAESQSKKMDLFNRSNIVVMTPQCLVDDLKYGRIKDLSIITLLIIDECHHTYSKHPYNILMSRYLDDKIDKENCQLPQVIGLTAVVGIDVAKSGKSAKEHFMEICANLDCDELCITKKNVENLEQHVPTPAETIKSLPMMNESEFSKLIKEFMSSVHKSLNDTELRGTLTNFGTTQYIGWLRDAKKIVNSSPLELKHEFASLQYLEICNKALQILKGYRGKDAMQLLQDYLESETLDTDAFQNLKILLKSKLDNFEKCSTTEELEVESPCLLGLVNVILEKFEKKTDSRVIVFVETKNQARILARVLRENDQTTDFKPQYLMAGINTDTGHGMSINKQKEVLGLFRSGECKLLVSTPVAEEGLDVQKCNLVIDYLTVQGVRAHVQKRGRARAADGEYIQIIDGDQLLNKRAIINRIKVDQMQIIVDEVYEDQLKYPVLFKETLKQIQVKNKQERATSQIQKVKPVLDSRIYTLRCTSCNSIAAESSDFRIFEEKCYVIINPDFHKNIDIMKEKPSILFDNIKNIGCFFCRTCKLYWGTRLVYKNTIFNCIKIKQFKIVYENYDPIVVKKWVKVPFKDAVQPLSEEDIEMVRKDRDNEFKDDVLVISEKFPIPESNPNGD